MCSPMRRRSGEMLRAELKTGLIPRVYVERATGNPTHAVLMTDLRAILVYEDSNAPVLGHALGGALGASIAASIWKPRTFDYESIHPEVLARDPKNTVLFHENLESIELRRHFGGLYKFHIRCRRPSGGVQKVVFALAPPAEYLRELRRQGVKDGFRRYIAEAQDLYRHSLPSGLAVRAAWLDVSRS